MPAANSQPPRVRPLPRHEEHRRDLLAAIREEETSGSRRPRRRRLIRQPVIGGRPAWLAPAAAAAAVLVLVAAALGAGSLIRSGSSPRTNPASAATSRTGEPSTSASATASAGQRSVTDSYQVTTPVTTLIVNDGTGEVSITGGATNTVSIVARIVYTGSRPSVSRSISGRTLTLGYSCADCGVRFQITVPRSMNVTANTQAGQVSLAGLAGALDVKTGVGAIEGSDLSAATARFQAGTGLDAVTYTAPPRQLSATSQTGTVTVRVPSSVSYRVTADSQLGVVNVSVPRAASSGHVISASSITGVVTVAPA
jgi:hypothetical protein